MIAYRRREFAARNHHSFPDPIHRSNGNNRAQSGEVDFITRPEGIGAKYDYFGRSQDQKSIATCATRSPRRIGGGGDGEEEFRWVASDEDESDIPSPKMWKEQGGSPTARSPNHHHQPTLRAQAIARYRQEMMGLVRDVPEPAYELSLKDLVELPKREKNSLEESPLNGGEDKGIKEQAKKGTAAAAKKKGTAAKKKETARSKSLDSGVFLLKMFPFSLGWQQRRRRNSISRSSSGTCSKVSPKPTPADGEKAGLERSTDGEWWRKNRFRGISRSSTSSSKSSSRSSSGGSSNSSRTSVSGGGNLNSSRTSVSGGGSSNSSSIVGVGSSSNSSSIIGGGGGSPNSSSIIGDGSLNSSSIAVGGDGSSNCISSNRSRKMNGCYSFFHTHRNESPQT